MPMCTLKGLLVPPKRNLNTSDGGQNPQLLFCAKVHCSAVANMNHQQFIKSSGYLPKSLKS